MVVIIPILYESTETNFNHNGIGFLTGCTSCNVTENRNGTYELEAEILVDSNLYDQLKGKMIIKAKANDRFEAQLFRIYYTSKPLKNKITVKAEHISYELKDNFIPSLTFTGNPAATMEMMNANAAFTSRFNFTSDITNQYDFVFDKVNFMSGIFGSKGSILDTIGSGEIVRNNFDFKFMSNGGQNKNILLSYKKNMTGFKCEENQTNLITKIYPYATYTDSNNNETTVTLTEQYIESEYVNDYPNPIIREVDFTQYFDTQTETISEESLRTKASTYFTDTKNDIPSLTYTIELISLSSTEEYKDFALNENIGLNDIIIVRHEKYGLDTTVKVIKTKYDSLAEKYISIGLGQPKANLSTTISNVINSVAEATKDKVTNTLLNQAINELSDAITGYDGGYVRLNPPSNPSEILVMDNEDINLAQTVWRLNQEGFGVSTTGYNGTFYGLAKDGKLVIEEATANKINAALINAGVLKSLNNLSWINLDDGTFNFNDLLSWNGSSFTINYAGTNLATALNNKLNTSDVGTAIVNNSNSVKTAVNSVSSYFQVNSSGATFGDTSTGDYTTLGANGMLHHVGGSNHEYMYVTYMQETTINIVNRTYTNSTGDFEFERYAIPYDSELITLLNGRMPKCALFMNHLTLTNPVDETGSTNIGSDFYHSTEASAYAEREVSFDSNYMYISGYLCVRTGNYTDGFNFTSGGSIKARFIIFG